MEEIQSKNYIYHPNCHQSKQTRLFFNRIYKLEKEAKSQYGAVGVAYLALAHTVRQEDFKWNRKTI